MRGIIQDIQELKKQISVFFSDWRDAIAEEGFPALLEFSLCVIFGTFLSVLLIAFVLPFYCLNELFKRLFRKLFM